MRADPDGPGLGREGVRTRTPAQDPTIRIVLDRLVSVELFPAVDTEPFVRVEPSELSRSA